MGYDESAGVLGQLHLPTHSCHARLLPEERHLANGSSAEAVAAAQAQGFLHEEKVLPGLVVMMPKAKANH